MTVRGRLRVLVMPSISLVLGIVAFCHTDTRPAAPVVTHGTVIVAALEPDEIAIAADSRMTTSNTDGPKTHNDSAIKVIPLSPYRAFVAAGLNDVHDDQGLKSFDVVNIAWLSQSMHPDSPLTDTAEEFARQVYNQLASSSDDDYLAVARVLHPAGTGTILEAIFAGLDTDGQMTMVEVSCMMKAQQRGDLIIDRGLSCDTEDPQIAGDSYFSWLGIKKGLAYVLEDNCPSKPPGLREWQEDLRAGQHFDPAMTVEALAAMAMATAPPWSKDEVGYPLHIYTINRQQGFRVVKTVREGHALTMEELVRTPVYRHYPPEE